MKSPGLITYIGITVLFLVWLWLGWGLVSVDGFNLKNILILAMSAIIIFLPLYKKYFNGNNRNNNISNNKGL